jgi:hypothetical protein
MKQTVYGILFFFLAVLIIMPSACADMDIKANAEEITSQDDTGGFDPSAFEGDSDSMAGERAPENMPMDDAPVDVGVGL